MLFCLSLGCTVMVFYTVAARSPTLLRDARGNSKIQRDFTNSNGGKFCTDICIYIADITIAITCNLDM